MQKTRVLIIEDEKDISELISLHLKKDGFWTVSIDNGEDALKLLHDNIFQLVILDWMLPGMSGIELCKKLRNSSVNPCSGVPILMVTARAHSSDIVIGLEMGCDDYLTKPFDVPVFLARAHSLLRRGRLLAKAPSNRVSLGNLSIDMDAYKVTCSQEEVTLTPSEFKLLVALAKNQGRVLTRTQLIDLVQGDGVAVVDRAIDTHIFTLRKKLGTCASLIESIRGVGYRIMLDG